MCIIYTTNNGKLKAGDVIVENGQLFKVFKIKTREFGNENEEVAYYKPLYKNGKDTSIVASIPVKNLKIANIRKPAGKDAIERAEETLKKDRFAQKVKMNILEDKVKENKIIKAAQVAKYLWVEKRERETSLPITKKRLLDKSLTSLYEQFAYANGQDLEKAERTVNKALRS